MTRDLLTAYENRRIPAWAHPLRATIPFVGRNYGRSEVRVLVYASAENLLTAMGDTAPWLGEGSPHAANRHDFAWRKGVVISPGPLRAQRRRVRDPRGPA